MIYVVASLPQSLLRAAGEPPAALGLIEGVADFLVSFSKLAGGYVGHHVPQATVFIMNIKWNRTPQQFSPVCSFTSTGTRR